MDRGNGFRYITPTAILRGETRLSGAYKGRIIMLSSFGGFMCSVNGGSTILVDQPNTGGGHVILSVPVKLNLNNGANSITFSINQDSEHRRQFVVVSAQSD